MSTKLSLTRDINGYNAFGIFPTYDIQTGGLAVNTEQHFTVPSNFENWLAIFTFTPGSNIWVSFTGTAAVPSTTVGSSTVVLNPSGRQVKAGSTISLITADTTTPWFCVELQVINNYSSLTKDKLWAF
jgi:hypothetical protein